MSQANAWNNLAEHHRNHSEQIMRDLFQADPQRFQRFSVEAAGLLLDYSKNRVTDETLKLLFDLAHTCNLEQACSAQFAGSKINNTEQRAVLHTALRNRSGQPVFVDGHDVMPQIQDVLTRLDHFCMRVREGIWRGYSEEMMTDIVHIGIGGSDLGPRFVCDALSGIRHERLRVHFVSNVDAHDLRGVLRNLNAARTLFIIASKTFTTLETMMNARTARAWCLENGVPESALALHFAALSTNLDAVRKFGIAPENMFPFWDWVGGRFSLWSAIGLPIALQCGMNQFIHLLEGAHAMDQHFATAPLAANMPVLLALTGIWNRNILGAPTLSIAPYHQRLSLLPNHLQQMEMESNGKGVSAGGMALDIAANPVIWGQCGTNGQHAYFQWLHQDNAWAPVDFIAVLRPDHHDIQHQRALLANCFAQSEALMRGKTLAEVQTELSAAGINSEETARLAPHKVFPGNRPSNTILLPQPDAYSLGALIALYEHKVFVQGIIWGVNSFDQWGVEWGKSLAQTIAAELEGSALNDHDSSTAGLIARAKAAGHC